MNSTQWSFDVSILKLLDTDKFNVDATAIFWRQPELFARDPYREKLKNGFMFTINNSYAISRAQFTMQCRI